MRVTIEVFGDLEEAYRREADERALPIESVMEGRLAAATRLDPRRRYVVVDQPVLGKIEEKLGGGHLQDEGDLLAKVQRLVKIDFEGYELKLTPGQLEELAYRAKKQGRTLGDMVQAAYDKFAGDFFTLVP